MRRQIDALLDEYIDAEVARILNEQQMRTGAGDLFDTTSIKWVRYSANIKSLKERLLDAGMAYGQTGVGQTRTEPHLHQ